MSDKPTVLSAERRIAVEPAAIWPLLDNVERHREWDDRVRRGETLGESRSPGGGERRERIHMRPFGVDQELELLVVEHEPERRIAWQTQSARLASQSVSDLSQLQRFLLEEEDGATRLRVELVLRPEGLMQRATVALVSRREKGRLDRILERIDAIARGASDT